LVGGWRLCERCHIDTIGPLVLGVQDGVDGRLCLCRQRGHRFTEQVTAMFDEPPTRGSVVIGPGALLRLHGGGPAPYRHLISLLPSVIAGVRPSRRGVAAHRYMNSVISCQ